MDRVATIIDSFLKMDFNSFADISIHRQDLEDEKIKKFQDQMESFFNSQTNELKDAAVLIYITKVCSVHQNKETFIIKILKYEFREILKS